MAVTSNVKSSSFVPARCTAEIFETTGSAAQMELVIALKMAQTSKMLKGLRYFMNTFTHSSLLIQ